MLLSPLDESELAAVSHLPWQPWDDKALPCLPPRAVAWLAESGSLTQRLRELGLTVSVQLLREGMTPDQAWQRQVLLLAGETPWLWGFTQLSAATLAACPAVAAQGKRPIGDWLFGLGGAQRLSLEWCVVPTDTASLLRQLAPGVARLWGRRTRLQLQASCPDGSPAELWLTELFLPGSELPPCPLQEGSAAC